MVNFFKEMLKKKIKNSLCIGREAGCHLESGENIVIIGDNIKNLDPNQKDVLYLSEKILIGKELFGKPLNLQDIIIDGSMGLAQPFDPQSIKYPKMNGKQLL